MLLFTLTPVMLNCLVYTWTRFEDLILTCILGMVTLEIIFTDEGPNFTPDGPAGVTVTPAGVTVTPAGRPGRI